MLHTISNTDSEYRRYKALAEGAIRQRTDAEFFWVIGESDGWVAVVCRHMAGNLRAWFTDFLTRDGEKTWRDRDREFDARQPGRRDALCQQDAGDMGPRLTG